MALSCVGKTFTHYDLHMGNVLLYEPVKGKYIEYHYHNDSEEVVFKSNYIVKIIDYGRSFFKDNSSETGSTEKIMKHICETPECNSVTKDGDTYRLSCGTLQGYTWVRPRLGEIGKYDIFERNHHYGYVNNTSYDLRLMCIMYMMKDIYNRIDNSFRHLLKKVVYDIKTLEEGCRGTIENKESGLPKNINNIYDAHDALLGMVKDSKIKSRNEEFEHGSKLGELHVYYDGRPMKFIPESSH